MTEDRSIIDKIREVVESDTELYDNISEEDMKVIKKIQALIEAEGDELEELELAAERISVEEQEAEAEETAAELTAVEEALEESVEEVAEVKAAAEEKTATEEAAPLPVPPTGEHKRSWATAVEERFNRLNPKTKVGRFFAKDRHNATLAAMIALAVLCGGWQLTEYLIPQKITVDYQSFDGSEKLAVSTRATTVEGAVAESGLEIAETDYVYPDADHPIKDGDSIVVKKAVETNAVIAGQKQSFWKIPGSVEDNLAFNEVDYDSDDIVLPERDKAVSLKSKIVVKEVHKIVKEKKEKQKAKSVVVLDPSLTSGKVQTTKGHDGEGIFTYTTTYVNGKKTKTVRAVKKWIKKPEDNALRLGTSLTGHKGNYKVSREFIANTTAYYMGENAHGAAGGHCVYGTCAVDPRVIPYGTVLFVEGYGVAVANDCGGAIKGDKLDLWMHSYDESCRWGRRFVKTYVLYK